MLRKPDAGALNAEHLVYEPLVGELYGEGRHEVHGPVHEALIELVNTNDPNPPVRWRTTCRG